MLNTDSRYAFYQPGDVVGRSGVEQTYDALRRGKDGSRDVIVNSHGKEIGQLGYEQAVAGQDLNLTIDLDVQMAAEKALEGRMGAIVAMDPHTGEILALASRPTFDPNQFSVRVSKSYWSGIINNPDHPLLNKAIQAQMAPGSTFKIIMSVAGLQENVAQTMHVPCSGGATFYGHFYACDKHHGMVDINSAIPLSCEDTYYYTLANRLGIDTIANIRHFARLLARRPASTSPTRSPAPCLPPCGSSKPSMRSGTPARSSRLALVRAPSQPLRFNLHARSAA